MKQYTDSAFVPRPTCYRCFRPEPLCYCGELRTIDNRTRVIVVQHPREQFHPLNTARIAEHSLRSSVVIRHRPSDVSAALKRARVSPDAAILFPTDDAEQLETLPPSLHPKEIIVVDGTWGNAKNLLRDVPELQRYRRLKFTPTEPSAYRIRREPRADYLSTIESVAYVLRYLEPDTEGIHFLEETFSRMIDQNIAARRPSESGSRFQRREKTLPHQFPAELRANLQKMVVAYCEGTRQSSQPSLSGGAARGAGGSRQTMEPLVLYFKRLKDDETLRLVLRTKQSPPDRLLAHLAIEPRELLEEGVTRVEAHRRIDQWLGKDEMLVVWSSSSLRTLRDIGLPVTSHLLLKGAFCDYLTYLSRRASEGTSASQRDGWGGMESFLQELGLPAPIAFGKGRGALRLAQTEALLRWILPFGRA